MYLLGDRAGEHRAKDAAAQCVLCVGFGAGAGTGMRLGGDAWVMSHSSQVLLSSMCVSCAANQGVAAVACSKADYSYSYSRIGTFTAHR